ncbi:MAG: hypothetical protein IT546_12510 [Caulobacteraceae bacterium]|nr:hypothetical protein [Caulobacteraceae bacterium]
MSVQVRFGQIARRRGVVLTTVALAHLGLFAALLLAAAPTLRFQTYDEPVFTVELLRPSTDQPSAPSPAPRPRFIRPTPRPSAVAPLYVPTPPQPAAPSPASPPLPGFEGQADDPIRKAFRARSPGCANRDAAGLTQAERDACDERFGEGAKDAPFLEAAIGKEKRADFDRAAAKKRRDYVYKRANVPPGTATPQGPGVLGPGM